MNTNSMFVRNIIEMKNSSLNLFYKSIYSIYFICFIPAIVMLNKDNVIFNLITNKFITLTKNKCIIRFKRTFNDVTVSEEISFCFYNCRNLMISNIKLIRLFTIVRMQSMKIMDMLIR